MDKLEKFFRSTGDVELCVIGAFPTATGALHVAFEVYEKDTKEALTAIATIDPKTLAMERLAEIEGYALNYLTDGQWHGVIQRTGVAELRDRTVTVTPLTIPDHRQEPTNSERARLNGFALDGDKRLVFGVKASERHVIDGFVARLENGKLEFVLETSNSGVVTTEPQHEGHINAAIVRRTGAIVAGGSACVGQQGALRHSLFLSRNGAFEIVALPWGEIYSLCEASDGSILVGCRDGARVVAVDGTVTALSGASARWLRSSVEFGGESYWLAESRDSLEVVKRSGDALEIVAKTKPQSLMYRKTYFEPPMSSMHANESLLVVTNRERLHLFDGSKWSQLALQRDAKKPVKRLAAGMK